MQGLIRPHFGWGAAWLRVVLGSMKIFAIPSHHGLLGLRTFNLLLNCCFFKLRVLSVGVLMLRALLFGVYIRAQSLDSVHVRQDFCYGGGESACVVLGK